MFALPAHRYLAGDGDGGTAAAAGLALSTVDYSAHVRIPQVTIVDLIVRDASLAALSGVVGLKARAFPPPV
jgi:hypothetical protein